MIGMGNKKSKVRSQESGGTGQNRRQKAEIIDEEFKAMILDYMEKGFLENIIDMFKHDKKFFPLIIDMIKDERVRVRVGAVVLVEEMIKFDKESLVNLIPHIGALLKDKNPTVRGDSAYILDIIRNKEALPYLLDALEDKDENVREVVEDAIRNIKEKLKNIN
jgi:hypothetical protein